MRRRAGAALAALALALLAAPAQAQELIGSWPVSDQGGRSYETLGGIAADARGYVYVAVRRTGRIMKYTGEGAFVRTFGDPPEDSDLYDDDRPDEVSSPEGMAVGPDGRLFVVESGARTRVSVWSATGRFLTAFADRGEGDGQLASPEGIAVDAGGSVYVADSGNHRVQQFGPDGRFVRAIGTGAFVADPHELSDPSDVAVAPDGTLHVTDALYRRVQHYSADGVFLGSFGSQGDGDGQFAAPHGIAASGDALFVADRAGSTVQRFGLDGAFQARVGDGPGAGPAQMSHPQYLATDCRGTLYVADRDNRRVLRFGAPGTTTCGNPADDPDERLTLVARVAARQRFAQRFAVTATAGCDRPCAVSVGATVRIGRRAFRAGRQTRAQPGEAPVEFLLTLSERRTDRVLAALRRRRRVTATVTIAVTDARGQTRRAIRRVRLTR